MLYRQVFLSAALLVTAAGAVHAQDHTPPDTSVKTLEPPVDVRKSQTQPSKAAAAPRTEENKQTSTGGQPGGGAGKN